MTINLSEVIGKNSYDTTIYKGIYKQNGQNIKVGIRKHDNNYLKDDIHQEEVWYKRISAHPNIAQLYQKVMFFSFPPHLVVFLLDRFCLARFCIFMAKIFL